MRSPSEADPSKNSTNVPDVLISVRGASKKFCHTLNRSLRYMTSDALHDLFGHRYDKSVLRRDEFWALHDVSFNLRRGESIGIMGINGAGKSTLLKLIMGSLRLTIGEVITYGRVGILSEHGLGFDPLLTGRENIYLAAAILEINRQRADQAFDDIVAFAELHDFIDSPVRSYSTGMRARLGFAVAMYLEPEILLVDEVLAVGDIGFQRRCIQHAQRYLERGGSLVLVSHNPHLVQFICSRCLVLDHGIVVWEGDAVGGVAQYLRATRTSQTDPLLIDPSLSDNSSPVPVAYGNMVAIEDCGILPLSGPCLRSGQPARVYVRYRAVQDVEVRWGFSVLTADLSASITSEGLMEATPIPEGVGELSAVIPRLPLVAGRFALRTAIMDPQTELPYALAGFDSVPRYFTVEATTSFRNNYRMYTRDLVVLEDVKWQQCELQQPQAATASE